ncbi:MAG: type II toxin-antitoxin system prevent-host-death family antitoxin [Syntrophobacteraceae bacterium]|nr:type II toxin-antitoxin system prevent-host-death family antitoxin [Syntrophobacteraceae bacterium]
MPILIITQNGEAKAVMQDIESYEQTQETMALLKIHRDGNLSNSAPQIFMVEQMRETSRIVTTTEYPSEKSGVLYSLRFTCPSWTLKKRESTGRILGGHANSYFKVPPLFPQGPIPSLALSLNCHFTG